MRFSDHSLALLHSCPLKYELLRGRDLEMVTDFEPENLERNPNIDYGRSLGIGFQELLRSRDLEKAVFKVSCSYGFWEDEKKCFEGLVAALQQLKKEFPLDLYELVIEEAGVRINLGEEDFWCGFVDGVLRRTDTGKYIIGEIKSCGQSREDLSPLYQNSGQALGYSVVLPELCGEEASYEFDVMYIVAHMMGQNWFPKIKVYTFEKSQLQRWNWILGLKLDYEQYCRYRELDVFPARGGGCMAYNKPCTLMGICDKIVPGDFPKREEDFIDQKEDWDLEIGLDQLIENEMNRGSE